MVALFLGFLSTPATSAADYQGVPLKLAADVATGVGVVQPLDCQGRPIRTYGGLTAGASGFLIGSRLLMTVEHGINGLLGATRGPCRLRVSLGGKWYPVTRTTVWSEPGKRLDRRGIDLGTFELARPAPGHIFSIADQPPRVGDSVAALGYPFGLPISVSQGIVRKTVKDRGLPTLAALIVTEAGNSGGPVVNRQGEVVSIVSRLFPVANPARDGPNHHGGIDLVRWWGKTAKNDLCRAHPGTGIPDCPAEPASAFVKVPVDLRPRR